MRQKGFTLIEMIIIIVLVGILLPAIFLPFINASKGIVTPAVAAGMSSVARKVMDEELARLDIQVWPTLATCPPSSASFYCPGPPPAAPASVSLNNNTYTSTITETFCDGSSATNPLSPAAPCVNAAAAPTLNHYLVIQVTTTASSGGAVTFQTIKTYDY